MGRNVVKLRVSFSLFSFREQQGPQNCGPRCFYFFVVVFLPAFFAPFFAGPLGV
ncbi:MAG: hypothetical protein K0Q95_422 [Bacteroidota bacterium]|jgi:hypothetical protein|nr:hypothetical protein [Bacteroidota bacterium]